MVALVPVFCLAPGTRWVFRGVKRSQFANYTHPYFFLSLIECWLITAAAVPQLSKWCFLSCLILIGPCTLHERFSRLAILFGSAMQAAVVKMV